MKHLFRTSLNSTFTRTFGVSQGPDRLCQARKTHLGILILFPTFNSPNTTGNLLSHFTFIFWSGLLIFPHTVFRYPTLTLPQTWVLFHFPPRFIGHVLVRTDLYHLCILRYNVPGFVVFSCLVRKTSLEDANLKATLWDQSLTLFPQSRR